VERVFPVADGVLRVVPTTGHSVVERMQVVVVFRDDVEEACRSPGVSRTRPTRSQAGSPRRSSA
jgi:hypothetical protein